MWIAVESTPSKWYQTQWYARRTDKRQWARKSVQLDVRTQLYAVPARHVCWQGSFRGPVPRDNSRFGKSLNTGTNASQGRSLEDLYPMVVVGWMENIKGFSVRLHWLTLRWPFGVCVRVSFVDLSLTLTSARSFKRLTFDSRNFYSQILHRRAFTATALHKVGMREVSANSCQWLCVCSIVQKRLKYFLTTSFHTEQSFPNRNKGEERPNLNVFNENTTFFLKQQTTFFPHRRSFSRSGLSCISHSRSKRESRAAGSWMLCSIDFFGL